jgi:GntR family histidine utilization transcriptional repressor
VQSEIMRRITDGPWGPGSLIPAETDLAVEFGCSRATINRALREVTALGLIDRRRKAGTRVRLAPRRQARFEIPLVRAEIEASGATYHYALIRREVVTAPDWLQRLLGLADRTRVVHLVCLHSADRTPYQLEDRWINAAVLPQAEQQPFAAQGPNEWLVATVPYSEVEISFHAIAADTAEVTHLNHAPGAPVFHVKRTTWWQGAAITHVALSHAAGHRMTARY